MSSRRDAYNEAQAQIWRLITFSNRIVVVGLAAVVLVCAPAAAQTGNLVPNGRFDLGVGVTGWQVVNPEYNALVFDSTLDVDGCAQSGVAHGICDPPVDFGTGEYRVCLGAVSTAESFTISGELLFLSSAVEGHANLTLTFWDGPNCTGDYTNGLFAGYAVSDVTGWQHVEAGPVSPDPASQSAMMRVLLTQIVGSQPAIEVRFDEIRVTLSDWVFAEDLEIGETCRWSQAVP